MENELLNKKKINRMNQQLLKYIRVTVKYTPEYVK